MATLLGTLLNADPAFGSGASSFSSGLETLVGDGLVGDPDGLVALMTDAVRLRWNTFDRVFLSRSYALGCRSESDADRLALDRELEVSMPGHSARGSSRRAGAALLGTWARLGSPSVIRYRHRVKGTAFAGHLAVAQGLVWSERGLTLDDAEALACWAVLSAYASGAVRLGVVGHRSAQFALITAERELAPLLEQPVPDDAVPHSFTPIHDIALERHRLAELKLFVS